MIEITEKDNSTSWEEITELLHRAYAIRKERGLNYAAATQTVEETIHRAQPEGAIKNVTLVAKENGKLVGSTTYNIRKGRRWYEGEKALFFHMVGVAPEQKGKGLGNRLIGEVIEIAEKEGCDTVVFDTAQTAKDLLKWYTNHFSFQKVGLVSWPNTNYYSVEFVKYLKNFDDKVRKKTRKAYVISSIKMRIKYRPNGKPRAINQFVIRSMQKAKRLLTKMIAYGSRELSRLVPYKRVLLFSAAPQMDEHTIDFFEIVKDTPRVKFYLLKQNNTSNRIIEYAKQNQIAVLTGDRPIFGCIGRYFDIAVTPDSFFWGGNFRQVEQPKKIYLNHGLHIVGRNDGNDTYIYSSLYPVEKFDVICEPNKRIADHIKETRPELKNIVRWVGWKFSETERQAILHAREYRTKLGFKEDDMVVFAVSTWGENSLFHTLGKGFLQEIENLSSRYRFILSAHPLEYQQKEGIGQELDRVEGERIRVRKVGEDWLPYTASADIVISDYSTLTEAAITMGKKVILSDFPKETVWCESTIAKARPYLPVIRYGDSLADVLQKSEEVTTPSNLNIKGLKEETHITRLEYEKKIKDIMRETLGRS